MIMFGHFKEYDDGEPVKTKYEYPYSYDPILQYGTVESKKCDGSAYSDRMYMWNPDKFDQCFHKAFGHQSDYFSDKSPSQIQSFLREYYDNEKLVLVRVVEYCNVSNGYPCWLFQWNDK